METTRDTIESAEIAGSHGAQIAALEIDTTWEKISRICRDC